MDRRDSELVQLCLAGDGRAWAALVDRYERLVYSIPRRFGLNSTDCDDVAQTTFIVLFRRLASVRELERLTPWLITTAHRETWRVAKRRRRGGEVSEELPDPGEPTADQLATLEREQMVRDGLRELGGSCEQLLTALFLEREIRDYQTIAADLGIAVGSIGPTRGRCLEKLEAILRRRGL